MVQSSGDSGTFESEQAAEAVGEFVDREHRRASLVDGDRLMLDPGKVLTNIENTMGRIDADINTHVSIADDLATEKELMAMFGDLMMGPTLVVFLVNTGMRIMKARYADELVTRPLPDNYDVTVMVPVLAVNERQHEIAKAIFNRRTTSSQDLSEDDVAGDLEPLDLAQKMEVFIILFYMWGTKIGALKDRTGIA